MWQSRMVACIAAALATGNPMLTADSRAGDVAYGEYLASECVTCHQRSGTAHGIPSIVGWPQDQFVAVLNAYRWKERDSPVMQSIAGRLTDEDIEALAAYFESLEDAQKGCEPKPQLLQC